MRKTELIAHLRNPKAGHEFADITPYAEMLALPQDELENAHWEAHGIATTQMTHSAKDPHEYIAKMPRCSACDAPTPEEQIDQGLCVSCYDAYDEAGLLDKPAAPWL